MDTFEERVRAALAVPMQHAMGAELVDQADVSAGVRFVVDGIAVTPMGTLHAAALGAVLEVAAYLAVLPELAENEHAVTHAISTQLLAAAHAGERVDVRATLLRRSRSLAFVTVAASVGDKPIAHAQVTKSVLRVD